MYNESFQSLKIQKCKTEAFHKWFQKALQRKALQSFECIKNKTITNVKTL